MTTPTASGAQNPLPHAAGAAPPGTYPDPHENTANWRGFTVSSMS